MSDEPHHNKSHSVNKRQNLTKLIEKWWLPLVAILLLAVLCVFVDIPEPAGKKLGRLIGKPIYKSYVVITLGTLFFLALGPHRKWKHLLWWPLDVIVGNIIAMQSVKWLAQWFIDVSRPEGQESGFPSGHSSFSFALAWLILGINPRLGAFWLTVATIISWSRLEARAHYMDQVVAGALVGSLVGGLITTLPDGLILPRIVRYLTARRRGISPRDLPVSEVPSPIDIAIGESSPTETAES